MTLKKIGIVVLITMLVLAVLAVTALVAGKKWAVSEVSQKISHHAEKWGWQVEMDEGSWLEDPRCLGRISLLNDENGRVTLHDVCISDGIQTLWEGDPNIAIECGRIEGSVDWDALKKLRRHASGSDSLKNNHESWFAKLDFQFNTNALNLKIGKKGRQVKMSSSDLVITGRHGVLSAGFSFVPALDIEKSRVAVRNMPSVEVRFEGALSPVSAQVEVKSDPPLELAFSHQDHLYEVSVRQVNLDYKKDFLNVDVRHIDIFNPDFEGVSKIQIASANAQFEDLPETAHDLKSLKIVEPQIKMDLPALLKVPAVKTHPVISKLVDFWQQDAGSFLGEAPNNSVRRADVKKNKPVVRKNPISRDTLNSVRKIFNDAQKVVQSLPAIDIQNGKIDIISHHGHFQFDSISFNTAELFKDSQKLQLDFNVREATTSFLIGYDNASPYPTVSLDIKNLASEDFLHILNMPVPDKNDGLVSLDLGISMNDEELRLAGNIGFRKFAFYNEKISPNLIHDINASAHVDMRYIIEKDTLNIEPVVLTSGPVTLNGFVRISDVRSNPVIDFELGAKDIVCADIPKAIPPGFLPTITDLRIGGSTISPKITGRIPWRYPLTSKLTETGFDNSCIPLSVGPHFPEILNDKHYTFTTRYTYYVDEITVGPGTKSFVPLEAIPPYVRAAMFLTEDKRFFDHGPLRIAFIERALRLNLNQRRYVYGGSTIAQQLTKNLFLNRNKNLARKLEEAFIAWRMEAVVPRMRIFELYLNVIEFGPDVYGIRNASQFYFGKEPSDLTPIEGAYLASLKVSPSKGGRFYKSGFPSSGGWWRKRFRYIMRVLAENGYISPLDVIAAYDWLPRFDYPSPGDTSDYRTRWLVNYGNSPQPRAKAARQDSVDEADDGFNLQNDED